MGIFLIYDVTKAKTWENIRNWVGEWRALSFASLDACCEPCAGLGQWDRLVALFAFPWRRWVIRARELGSTAGLLASFLLGAHPVRLRVVGAAKHFEAV